MGRRAWRRGGRQQREQCGDTEGSGLADVRLGCDGGCGDSAPAAYAGRGRDEG